MLSEVRCTKCTHMILRKSRDGFWRVSSRVLRAASDGQDVVAICKGCGTEQTIPMIISMPPLTLEQQDALKKGFTFRSIQVKKNRSST